MKRTIIFLILMVLVNVGCSKTVQVLPDLLITGDIQETTNLNRVWNDLGKEQVSYDDQKLECVNAQELLQSLPLVYEQNEIYLKARDGFMIKLADNTLGESYFGYSETKNWVFISEKHPVNSRIKNISEIIIVNDSNETAFDFGLNIIIDNKTINYSPGELLTKPYLVAAFSDGITTKKHDNKNYEVNVMQQRKIVEFKDLVTEEINSLLVMDEAGEYDYIYGESGYIEIGDNGINLILTHKTYRNIEGIMVNPPSQTVMDTYEDTLHYLKQDDKVMVIFIDGFSYSQYEYFLENNREFFISGISNVTKANTVFKPVTNAGFAAMITGQPPKINGILNRSFRELKVDTIFDKASELNKKSILIEGDTSILNTKLAPSLNIDLNKNGITDDEIYQNALQEINNDYDLFFVHFHSLDEFGHNYGELNVKIVEQMALLDKYVQTLINSWNGKVIIVSDHGMHNTADGGSHGEFRTEDMFIPYMILDGGKQ